MLILDANETAQALPRDALVEALRDAFQQGVQAPLRHHHTIQIPNEADANLLIMPAWQEGKYLGIKNVMVIPENHKRGTPSVVANYQLYSAVTGKILAIIDGQQLTNRRTAAASALASTYLSRVDSKLLLMIGAGSLASHLIEAHCAVRPIKRVKIWARDYQKAAALADSLTLSNIQIEAVDELDKACFEADIISSATLSTSPLILGDNVKLGTHVDLVGAFTPDMRESDDALIKKACLFADTLSGALAEGGDYTQPIADGLIVASDIVADLYALAGKQHDGRKNHQQITVFKSTGAALEDLAAGVLAYKRYS